MPKKGDEPPKDLSPSLEVRHFLTSISENAEFRTIIKNWKAGSSICWEGAWMGAVAPTAAAARFSIMGKGGSQKPHPPILIVVGNLPDAEVIGKDLEFLLQQEVDVFPASSDDSDLDSLLQQEVLQRLQVIGRLHAYNKSLATQQPTESAVPVLVTTLAALMQRVPSPEQLKKDRKSIQVGMKLDLQTIRKWLAECGYHTTTSVQMPGEYTLRGGILDVFPPDSTEPYRVEWFDDEVESIRTFDTVSQRSLTRYDSLELLGAGEAIAEDGSLLDYLPPSTMIFVHEPISVLHLANAYLLRVAFPERFEPPSELLLRLQERRYASLVTLAVDGYTGTLTRLPIGDVQRLGGELETLAKDIEEHSRPNRQVCLVCVNDGECQRMKELLASSTAMSSGRIQIVNGGLANGFEVIPDGPLVLTVNQLLRRSQLRRSSRKVHSRAIDSFLDLREGDLVVHLAHGIGAYRGLTMIERLGQRIEHLEIEFAENTKIFVPVGKIDLVQRYVGGTKSTPKLAKIGSQSWARQKKAAEEAVTDMASELLELQAQRASHPGVAFAADTVWQHQFDASFPYEETPDQITSIAAVKKDMIAKRPMDRLICGDVGFGKTEVAMRAAFKAIDSGYQVAVLVPTTVLAEQHYKTFRQRMAEFPFDIDKLSRFRTHAQQRETLKKLASGQIDIVIGTHRLASADVQFFNLGLVIVDEEQRFGVSVKERLKLSRPNVDVLTLSATPIPRTLHMSLLGVRDISNLETAPEERLAVETRSIRFDDNHVRKIILRELNRGGQIYFVHNRIQDIDVLADRLRRIVPEARIKVGHGQMHEHELEQVMIEFIDHQFDLLLSTTIIESGLDIPNANTILIDEADRYGLSELHQLRGRVGRYKHQAYCYLLVDRHKHLTPDAARRLHAIEEYSQIGAGFGIAMRDLEIRGAGNLLGTQQSGHIAAVGYELYCQLLENAVRQLTNQRPKLTIDVELNLPIDGFIPAEYVPEIRHKIDLYRRLSRIDSVQQVEEIRGELLDRFGDPPPPVIRLLEVAELRIDAAIWLIKYIGIEESYLSIQFADRARIEQLSRRHQGKLRVLDGNRAFWPLPEGTPDYLAQVKSLLQFHA